MKFMGYMRKDGQVGIRNHIIVISTVACINTTTQQIAGLTDTVPITHGYGCGQAMEDSAKTEWCLAEYAQNPNVAGVFVVGLGCEQIDAERLAGKIKGKPTGFVKVAKVGETNAIAEGAKQIGEMKCYASNLKREEASLSKLIMRVICGGSDATSGIASNPALGVASELLVKEGGAVLLESLFCCEDFYLRNVEDHKVIQDLWAATDESVEQYRTLPTVRGVNPSPGNMELGITTLLEKRMGGKKGGNAPFRGILTLGERPPGPGLYWVQRRGYIGYGDLVSTTMDLLQGTQITCFTTGYGSPLGLAIAPVIKITGNPETFARNQESMDINAGTILYGEETIEEVGKRIFNEIIESVNGKLAKSESRGHRDFFLPVFTGDPSITQFF